MVIEINKDIDRYKETVIMGLTARQLIFSMASVIAGGGIVLLLYRYIGLTLSVYIAVLVVAPIALGGFYSFNGMNFYEFMKRKIRFMFRNRALCFVSTEGESEIRTNEAAFVEMRKKKDKKRDAEVYKVSNENKEEFETMKKKTKKILAGFLATVIAIMIGAVVYKTKYMK